MRTLKLTDEQIDFLGLILEYINIDDLVDEDDNDDLYDNNVVRINEIIDIINRS